MIYLCKCGDFKADQPWHSAATKDWMCPPCKGNTRSRRTALEQRKRVRRQQFMAFFVIRREVTYVGLGRMAA